MTRPFAALFSFFIVMLACHSEDIGISNPEDLDYFPLAVGNQWHYEPLHANVPGFRSATFSITDTEVRGDKQYFVMVRQFVAEHISFSDTVLYRVDSHCYVLEIQKSFDTIERNSFRLSAANGHKWKMERSPHEDFEVITTIKNQVINDQVLPDCKDFYYNDPSTLDEEHYYVLAKGIGITQHGNAWGFDYRLKSAKIGNVEFSF